MAVVVVDSACLIGLERISQTELLPRVFSTLFAPPAVERELSTAPNWLHIVSPSNRQLVAALRLQLGAGESESIVLAVEQQCSVLLDDKKARSIAQRLNLHVIGTFGLLLRAKRSGIIPACKPLMDALIGVGFRISDELYSRTLVLAGEDR